MHGTNTRSSKCACCTHSPLQYPVHMSPQRLCCCRAPGRCHVDGKRCELPPLGPRQVSGASVGVLTTCFPVGGLKMDLAAPQVCPPEKHLSVVPLGTACAPACLQTRACPGPVQDPSSAPFCGQNKEAFLHGFDMPVFPTLFLPLRDSDLRGCWSEAGMGEMVWDP